MRRIFKKGLSVFLSLLMVMSSFAMLTPDMFIEAEALTAGGGSYYVRVYMRAYDGSDLGGFDQKYSVDSSTGLPTANDKNMAGFTLFYKNQNGVGSSDFVTQDISTDLQSFTDEKSDIRKATWDDTNTEHYSSFTYSFPSIGFPTRLYWVLDDDNILFWSTSMAIVKITVAASSTATEHILWQGLSGSESTSEMKTGEITMESGAKTEADTLYDRADNAPGYDSWALPAVDSKTVVWADEPEAMQCPEEKDHNAAGYTVSQYVKLSTAKDQYGVDLYHPTWSVKGSVCGTTGISVSPTVAASGVDIRLNNLANVASNVDDQTGTITAHWGSSSVSKTFTITDSYYTAKFSYQSQNDDMVTSTTVTEEREGYHGDTITPPTVPSYYEGDNYMEFTGWLPAFNSIITANVEYTADYSGTKILADYTDVDNAIAEVDEFKANVGAEYELKYTSSSRLALETAINTANQNRGLGRTQQSTVDGYAQTINDALAGLEINKFAVIFLDRNGAIILYDKNAEYKSSITPPEFPEDQKVYFDAEKHYTYTGWDSDEYTSVIDDLVIAPVYTEEEHDWETETVTSTCVQAGTTKYTCKVCGYVKYDGGDQLGDHVWEDDYTVDLEPNCVLEGSKSIHCSLCDERKDVTSIPANGHTWDDFEPAVDPTCDTIGISTRVCAEEDCKFCEHLIVDALGHDYVKTTVPATCTEKGYDEYVCQTDGCGHSYRDNYTETTAPHTYGEWETVTDAHCGVAGVQKQTCKDCGHINIGTIPALEHDKVDWTVVVEPVCGGKGYQIKYCSKCQNIIDSEELAALEHDFEDTYTPADCDDAGYTTYVCKRENCGHTEIVEDENAPATGHDFVETTSITPTCTKPGEKTQTCSNCGTSTKVEIAALGHTWGTWTVTPSTNTVAGSVSHTCEVCNTTETVAIPEGGHKVEYIATESKPATCNEEGKAVFNCTVEHNPDEICEIRVEYVLPKTQHTVATKEEPATCTKKGAVITYCSECDAELTRVETKMLPHNYVAGEAVAPTCTTSGYTVYTCDGVDCGETYNKYDDTKPATGHKFTGAETTVTKATCTTDGLKKVKCAVCDVETEVVIPKLGHTMSGTWTQTAAPDCTADGEQEMTCTNNCGEKITAPVPALGHSWGEWTVSKVSTNTKEGELKRTCSECGEPETVSIPAGGHNLQLSDALSVEPGCETEGKAVFVCVVKHDGENACDVKAETVLSALGHDKKVAYTAATCQAAGSVITTCDRCTEYKETITVPVLSHVWGEGEITEATCQTAGKIAYACTNDGCTATREDVIDIDADAHSLTTTVTDAKCEEAGSVVTKCTNTGCTHVAFEKEIPATGHTITVEVNAPACETEGSIVKDCENCDAADETITIPALKHNYSGEVDVVTEATCTETGTRTIACVNVGCTEKKAETIAKLPHSWGPWVVAEASTNDSTGLFKRVCTNDGCTAEETIVIPAGGHDLEYKVTTEATCTTEGKAVIECKAHENCDIEEEVSVPALGHDKKVTYIDATCTTAGSVVTTCDRCKVELERKATPKLPHNYVAGTVVAPTCTTSGYTVYTCDGVDCGETYNKYDDTKPATKHNYVAGTSTATCTTAGTVTLTCSACGDTVVTNVPALGHDYVAGATTEATCGAEATQTYNCSRCEASYTIATGDKTTDHDYPETWTVVKPATPTSIGYETRACSVCGQLEVQEIPATGDHNFSVLEKEVEANCTTDGYRIYSCATHTDCDLTSKVTLPKLGHSEKLVYAAATCEDEGSVKRHCDRCTADLETKTIEALGHAWGNEVVTPATCKAEGKIEYTCTRTDCTATHEVEISVDTDAHNITTEVTDAKCEEAGSVVNKCTNEGCTYSVEVKVIPATGHTTTTTVTNPKCGVEGLIVEDCDNCDYRNEITIPALKHSYSDDVEQITAPTCDANGLGKVECENDGCTETKEVVIPMLGHDYDEGQKVDADCTGGAYTIYECERAGCGHTKIEYVEGSTATGHRFEEVLIKEATCTAEGLKELVCKGGCGAVTEVVIPMLPHDWNVWTVTPPTHENEGSVSRKCKNCDATESVAIPAGDHDMVKDEAASTVPTCKAEGVTVYKCSDTTCDVELRLTESKLQHTVATKVEPATCTAEGYIRTYCSVCNEKLSEDVTIEKLAHNYVAGEYVDATCTTSGYTPYACKCGDAYNEYNASDKATGHNYEEVANSSTAGCTTAGKMTLKCSDCGNEITADVPALGHDYVAGETTDATCGAEATQTYDCSRCEASYTIATSDKLTTHSFGDWVVVENATNTSIGYRTRECSVCDKIEVETIPATGEHVFDKLLSETPATCTAAGEKTYGCSTHADCGLESTVTVPMLGHDEKFAYTAATCAAEGIAKMYCDRCKTDLETKTIEALGHAWGNEKVTPATCKAEGKIEYTCTRTGCTATETVEIPVDADAHSLATTVEDANCTEAGSVVTKCTNTGCTHVAFEKVIPATGHTVTTVVTNPKCGEIGTVVETCTNAGCDYSKVTTIPALIHSFTGTSEVVDLPTCDTDGHNRVACENTGCTATTIVIVPKLGHNYDEGVKTEGNCTNGGYTTYTCQRDNCGYVHVVLDGDTGSGHDFSGAETITTYATCTADGSKKVQCKDCDAETTVVIPKKGHAMSDWVQTKAPACEVDGEQQKTCANGCGEKITAPVSKLGHSWGAWTVEKASTNEETGLLKRTCERGCTERVDIPEGGHALSYSITKAPACDAEGKAEFVCTAHEDCGIKLEIVLDKIQHMVVTTTQNASCTNGGNIKTYCSKCGYVFSNEPTQAIAHTYVAGEYVDATCTTSGYTPYACNCGDAYNEYNASDKATGHNYEEVANSSTAGCTTAGKMTLKCSDCGTEITADVPALGHDYVAGATTGATCAAAATQTYDCSRCEATYTISVGDKSTEHKYGEWKVEKPATPESIGYETRECTVCGQIDVQEIPTTGDHVFDTVIDEKDPTCTEDGYVIKKCSKHETCGKTSTIPASKLGHNESIVYKAATCEEAGSVKRYCDRCKTDLETKTIEKLGHAWGNEVVVKATCKTAGKIAYSCTRCTATHEVEISVDTNAHSYTTTVTDATCTATGSVVVTCIYCGDSETTTLAQKGHIWKADATETIPASCTSDGKAIYDCENCDAKHEVVLAKLGHNWGEWKVVQPTATTDGLVSRKCTRGCEESVKVPAGNHEMVMVEKIEANCEASGSILYRCKDNCGIELTVILEKRQHSINTTVLEPTCSKPGYIKKVCGFGCGYVEETITAATNEHTLGEWTVVQNATCADSGILKRECTKCFGEDEFDTIPATGKHTYVGNWQTVYAPTCESSGVQKDVCTVCGEASITRQTDPIGHKLVTATTAATCEVDGLSVTTCENGCDYRVETAVPKLGHDYEKTAETSASCTAAPTETWTCKNDAGHTYTIITGVPNGHSYNSVTVVEQATCTEPEITRYVCACGDSYDLITAVPDGHNYIDNWQVITQVTATENGQMVRYCTVCNAAPEYATVPATGAHVFVKGEYVAPDCLTEGSQAWVCTTHTDCDANYTETIPEAGHKLVLDTQDATCTATGYVKLVCSVDTCGAEVDSYEVPMLSHTYTEVENSRQDATCTEPGSYKIACECGAEQTIAIPAKGHTYTTSSFSATCTQGAKTVYTCACGYTYTITTSNPLGHDWGEWTETKEATETEAGELTRECKNECGATETAPLAPTGEHSFVKDTAASVEATCTEGGTLVFKCTAEHDCGVTYTHNVAAKDHQLKLDFKQATCEEDGFANVYCVACGETIESNVIDKLGHNYKAEVTTEAECGEAGEVTYTCENCGHSYTEAVEALEHNFIVEVAGTKVAPTCIADGKVTMKCFNCDETEEKVLSKTGHLFDEGRVIVKPDCVTAGKIEYTCQYDHTHKFTEVIEPTGSHTLVGEVVEYEATCTRPARNEQYCEACANWVVIWESTELPVHKWNAWVVEKQPTAAENGYQYRVCSVCGEIEEMTLTAGRMIRVIFYNENGERLTAPKYYTYGSKVERPENPVKHETDMYTFEFIGWTYGDFDYEDLDAEIADTEKMIDYLGYGFDYSKQPGDEGYDVQEGYAKELNLKAAYRAIEKEYKVTYIDGNGNTKVVENVKYADIYAAYGGTPAKDSTEVYSYIFKEWQILWSKDKLTGENVATATAQYIEVVNPGMEDKIEKEPTGFMKFLNSIIEFFKNLLAKIGIKL